jgi:hypothetical protein
MERGRLVREWRGPRHDYAGRASVTSKERWRRDNAGKVSSLAVLEQNFARLHVFIGRRLKSDLLVSNPAAHAHAAKRHALNEAPRQTLSPRSTLCISVWIVHGNWLGSCEGVLSPSSHARVEGGATHDVRVVVVVVVEVVGTFLSL